MLLPPSLFAFPSLHLLRTLLTLFLPPPSTLFLACPSFSASPSPLPAAPYVVDTPATETPKESTAAATPAAETTAVATPAVVDEKPKEVVATPTPAPVAAATAAPAATKPQQKKKGGIFSMCCGGNSANYEN